jgi:hypothetical protein
VRYLVALVALLVATAASAQTVVNPTTAQFVASVDHALLVNGTAVVSGYQLDAMVGTVTGALAFSFNLGKPTPSTGNVISIVVPQLATLANGSYVATISALGPGGSGKSAPTPPFSRIGPAAAPTAVVVVP